MESRIIHKNFLIMMFMDIMFVSISWYFAHLLRFNFRVPIETKGLIVRVLPLIVLTKIIIFYFFDLYQGMWRYTSLKDLFNIIQGSCVASLIIVAIILFTHGFVGFVRSALIIDWGLTTIFIGCNRLTVRLFLGVTRQDSQPVTFKSLFLHKLPGKRKDIKKLLIIGAGDCGEKIYREIRDNASLQYNVVGFLDDDPKKLGRLIHGIPIIGQISEIKNIAERVNANEFLIAIPSAHSDKMRKIVASCQESGIPFKTLPGMGELIDGKVSIKAIRDVAYRDLLGREVIRLEEDLIGNYLNNIRVLVTGAAGSIGSELCRQICRFKPQRLILFDRAESPLYDIELELKKDFPYIKIIPVLADVQDSSQLLKSFEDTRPQVVFHAAAYKHVPMLEIMPWKAVKNNIIGTRNIIDISKKFNVDRFVFVSTDKAVRPTNVMGATKRVSEMLVQGQNGCDLTKSRFMIVRFGNVVGSVGSVVPLFKKQIEQGGPVTVTHPEVTRYFMTIPEACQLILQAGAMGKGGEIFILDMGTPIRIIDLARDLIQFSGFEPDVDIKIKFIGLRPGEKLYEELITEGEGVVPTTHEKIMVLHGHSCNQAILNGKIDGLKKIAYEQDIEGIRRSLKEIVPEYILRNGN